MKRITPRALSVLILLLCLGVPATAFSQDDADLSADAADEVDPEDIERAQEAFNQGATFYYEGEYGRAMVEFRRANELYPHPIFLHNIARSNRQLGRVERTIDAAIGARELAEETGEALPADADAVNSALIAGIGTVVTSTELSEEMEATAVADKDVEEPPGVQPADSGFGGKGWAGVAGLALGVGALGGAAMMDRSVVSGMEELEPDNWTGTRTEFDDEKASLESQQSMGQILLFSGAGLAAVGTTLLVLELTSSSGDTQMALSPSVTRPGVEMLLRW